MYQLWLIVADMRRTKSIKVVKKALIIACLNHLSVSERRPDIEN